MSDEQTEIARKSLDNLLFVVSGVGMLCGLLVGWAGGYHWTESRRPKEQLKPVPLSRNIRWVAPAGVGSPTNTGLTFDSPWDPETAWQHGIHGREFYFLPGAYGSITAADSYSNVFGPRPWVPARPR